MANSILLASLLLTLLLAPLASADENNVLLTGNVLTTDNQLSYRHATFVIQDDCNLVLYNQHGGFQSNTHGNGVNCTLTLNNQGQLKIYSADSPNSVWESNPPVNTTEKDKYAAVLGPDGQVSLYGPAVWSTPALNRNERSTGAWLANIPQVRNVLFSSQVLYNNGQLATRDYTFVMQDDCNLVLNKGSSKNIVWQSRTSGKGQHCYVRLGHKGFLDINDDNSITVWSTKITGEDGDYVLILQANGQAVVYGPVVWSTRGSPAIGASAAF